MCVHVHVCACVCECVCACVCMCVTSKENTVEILYACYWQFLNGAHLICVPAAFADG